MADESNFLIQILLEAKDNASATVAKLTAEVEALKRASSGDGSPTAGVSKDLDETGRAARDTAKNLGNVRKEHENLRQSSRGPEIRQSARDLDDQANSARTAAQQVKGHTVAVDDHRSATTRLGAGLKDSTQATKENETAVKSAAERAEEAAKSYEMFDASVRKGSVSADDARRGYAQFSTEIAGLVRQLRSGSDEALKFSKIADEAKSRSGDFGLSEAEIQRVSNAYRDFDARVKTGTMSASEARRGYKDLSSELGGVGRAFRAGSSEAEHFLGMAEQAGKKAKEAGYLAPGDWNWDNVIQKTAARFDDWGIKVVSLSANLRGLALAGVIGLAQQLDTAVVGLAGGLFSVASAAVQAGAALGGALVAGISQAIPVLGVIGATVQRLKSVFQAVSLSDQAEKTEAATPNKAASTQLQNADAVANAQHGLQNAYEGVATAQEHVRSSQEALTLARIDAIRNLQDLELAEKSAKLEAEGAQLSLTDAQRALQVAIQQGNTAGIQSAQLGVRQAELGVTKADEAVPRAIQDANRARRQGVDRNSSVVSATAAEREAKKAVSNQEFQIKQAQDQLKLARMQQAEPSQGQSSQKTQLQQLEKNFNGPEKALFEGLKRIDSMLKSPDSPLAKLTSYIVTPVAKGVDRITELLGNKSVMQPLDNLAKEMGTTLEGVENTLTDNKAVHFFNEMASDASTNVPIVGHAFDQLLGFFQSIAKTASPILHDILTTFDAFITRLNTKDSSPEGLRKLENFFSRAAGYARDILSMADAFGRLMMALGRDSAASGDNLITSLTRSMNQATEWVNTHGPEVKKFFEGTAQVVKQIGDLLFGVGLAMIRVFNPSSTAAFQQVMTQILLPALTKILSVLGWITTAILNIAKALPGGTVALQIIAGIAATLFGIGKLYEPIAKVVTIMKALTVASEAFTAATGMGRLTAAWEAFHGVMSKVKDETKAAAGAQTELNTAEAAGVGASEADAAGQGELAAAEGAGAAGGIGGLLRGVGGIALDRVLPAAAVLYGTQAVLPSGEGARPHGIPTTGSNFQRDTRQFNNEMGDIKHVDPVGFVKDFFGGSEANKSEEQLRKFGDQLKKIKGNLSDLPKGQMKQIHDEAVRLGEDPSLKKFKNNLEGITNATDPSLQATKRWSEKMREYLKSLGPAAKGVEETFQNINHSTGSILEQIREIVHTNSKKIAEDLGTNSKEGKDALVANFGQAVDAIDKSMTEGTVSTGKGMQEIGRLVSTALKEYGINPSQINKYVAQTGQVLGHNKAGGLVEYAAPRASGGWAPAVPGGRIYQAGEAQHDEVVLTTDPKHADRQRSLLGQYISRAPHVIGSFAKGGFVADSGTDQTGGKMPQIVAALQKLGEMLHTMIYGISGARSEAESAALGYPNDPHTKHEAEDIGVGSQLRSSAGVLTAEELARVGLYRPFYPSMGEAEINHVQLLGSGIGSAVAATAKGAERAMGVMANGYEITAPKVKGLHGQLQKVAQGAMNKVAKAAGEYVTQTIGTLPTPESGPTGKVPGSSFSGIKGSGGSPVANEKLGKEMMVKAGFPAGEWDDLKKLWTQESGWSDTAENTPSMGWLANGNASGIPQSDGHGQVYAKGDGKGQIAWGLNYIKEKYGSIAKAWASEMAIKSYAVGGILKRAVMAAGGKISSWGGRPQIIEAHEGERVMNPMQYNEAARLAGTDAAGLDQHMGYDGHSKQSFETGGKVFDTKGTKVSSTSGATTDLSALLSQANNALSSNSAIIKVFKAVHDGFVSLAKIEQKAGVFTKALLPFIESITNEQTGVIARLAAGFTSMTSKLTTATAKANFKPVKTTSQAGRMVSSAPPLEQTDRSLKDLATERKNLQEQEKIINDAEKQIQKRIQALSKKKQTSAVKKELQQLVGAYNSLITAQQTVEEQTAQNLEAAAQAAQQRVQDVVTSINNTIGLEGSKLQAQQGNAQALGRLSELPAIDAQIAGNAKSHIQALEGALNEASAIGNSEMVASIKQEIIQLQQTVTSAAAQAIQDAEAAIAQQAGVQTAYAGFDQVKANVAAAQGKYVGQGGELEQSKLGYQTEISSDRSQLGPLRKLLAQAESEGNEGAIATLTETIINLEGSILTNEQAIKDNTAIVTQQYTAQVTREGSFATGVYGGLIGILKTAGEITGKTDVGGEKKLYEKSNESLESTNKKLVGGEGGLNEFLKSIGVTEVPNLESLSGNGLIEAISNLNLSGIESHMDPAQQQTFEQIISALITNAGAIETNNKELANLNGSLTQLQTFSTTVFQKFRDSVFTGIGGLLPTYAEAAGVPANTKNPGLTGAGSLEVTGGNGTNSSVAPGGQLIEKQEVNIYTEDAPFDPAHAGRVLAFAAKTPAP